MDDLLPVIGPSLAIVVGGVLGSFGVNAFVRSRTGQSFVAGWRWWGLLLYYLAVATVFVSAIGWTARSLIGRPDSDAMLDSPWFFFGFGVALGLPFTLPTLTAAWRRAHAPPTRRRQPKNKAATRQDRLAFAKDLERQLREYGGDDRKIHVELQGEKGTVLFLGGDLSREEGERLVAALRSDFQEVDLQRVEGKGRHGKWWVRVG